MQHDSSREAFAAEVAAITRAEIEALIAEGVRYIQLDNPCYGRFVGAHARGASPRDARSRRLTPR